MRYMPGVFVSGDHNRVQQPQYLPGVVPRRNFGGRYDLELLHEHAMLRVLLLQGDPSIWCDYTSASGYAHPHSVRWPDDDWGRGAEGDDIGKAQGVQEGLWKFYSVCNDPSSHLAVPLCF